MRSVFDNVYVGGAPDALERIITQAGPAARFRAFAGYAGWGPGQLGFEMLQGSWAVLSGESNLFDKDPAALWPDSIARLQAPRVISW
jgi:putative transcriptional regulator